MSARPPEVRRRGAPPPPRADRSRRRHPHRRGPAEPQPRACSANPASTGTAAATGSVVPACVRRYVRAAPASPPASASRPASVSSTTPTADPEPPPPPPQRAVRPLALGPQRDHGRTLLSGASPICRVLPVRPLTRGDLASDPVRDDGTSCRPQLFGSVAEVGERLAGVGYLADDAIATTVFLADALGKPLLVEGPAGVGKTELAKAVATADRRRAGPAAVLRGPRRGARALRVELQEAAAAHPGRRATAQSWDETHDDIFTEEFLLARPLLTAIRRDRADGAARRRDRQGRRRGRGPAAGGALRLPGHDPRARHGRGGAPAVRRADLQRDPRAVRGAQAALPVTCTSTTPTPSARGDRARRVPEVAEQLAEQLVRTVRALRALELKKAPSIAETIDWARTLLALGLDTLDEEAVARHARRRAQARLRPRPRGQGARARS